MRRRLAVATAGAAAAVLLAGCTTGAHDPTLNTNGVGYVDGQQVVTRIAPADRKSLPTVSGPELGTGRTVSSADYPGKVVVLNVWGSWCAPCQAEALDLQAASVDTNTKSRFLGINVKDLDQGAPEAYVRTKGITYPSIYDPSSKALLVLAGQTSPSAIPSTLVVDAQGRLAVRVLGSISKVTLIDMINETAAGR